MHSWNMQVCNIDYLYEYTDVYIYIYVCVYIYIYIYISAVVSQHPSWIKYKRSIGASATLSGDSAWAVSTASIL